MMPLAQMSMEERIELIERRQRHMSLEVALALNYVRLIAQEMGLRKKAQVLNQEYDTLCAEREALGLVRHPDDEPITER